MGRVAYHSTCGVVAARSTTWLLLYALLVSYGSFVACFDIGMNYTYKYDSEFNGDTTFESSMCELFFMFKRVASHVAKHGNACVDHLLLTHDVLPASRWPAGTRA